MTKRISTSKALAVVCALVLAGAGCATETGGATAAPQSAAPADTGPRLRTVEANGIKLRIAEMGQGPLVIFLHGFPESWYSWRHQLPATAKAGFHAVAPDMRGYGKSDKPAGVDDYDIHHLTADVVGLIDALGQKTAVVVGHDWGALVAWNAVLLHPDRFTGRRGDERAVRRPVGGIAARDDEEDLRRQLLLHPVLPGTGRRRGRVRQGSARDPEPPVSLARLAARAAGDHRPQAQRRRLDRPDGRVQGACRPG